MSLSDDCDTILRFLVDAGELGLSQRQLEAKTQWGPGRVNDTLCALTITAPKRQVESFKERGPKGRKTAYRLIKRI